MQFSNLGQEFASYQCCILALNATATSEYYQEIRQSQINELPQRKRHWIHTQATHTRTRTHTKHPDLYFSISQLDNYQARTEAAKGASLAATQRDHVGYM